MRAYTVMDAQVAERRRANWRLPAAVKKEREAYLEKQCAPFDRLLEPEQLAALVARRRLMRRAGTFIESALDGTRRFCLPSDHVVFPGSHSGIPGVSRNIALFSRNGIH